MSILEAHHWPGNVRELRNLVESMVVLAPGREIGPADIPVEVRVPDSEHALLPVPVGRPALPVPEGSLRPELEFIFRTLVELRVDMDELKREFEAYRRDERHFMEVPSTADLRPRPPAPPTSTEELASREIHIIEPTVVTDAEPIASSLPPSPVPPPTLPGQVVFRSGMTMEELEREAIQAALQEVGGNRRKAAERLGIGERTLYRKIRKFGLD